ncbi:MAG: SagB/ThcOx family dehydrogenase [Elusimicrobia bacterium]|nr:SagB/ThcOx family dehydrogenase [Elusimicrobiota bacterium]
MKKLIFTALIAAFCAQGFAQTIELKKPQLKKGLPVMQALSERKSTREFSSKELDMQTISNLLWAANGVNRPDGKRTAPSAMNRQDIDVYICMADGAYLYNAKENQLEKVSSEDCRLLAAPVTLFLVANAKETDKYADIDAGIVAQNIALFSAGMGLVTVPRGTMPPADTINKALALKDGQLLKLNMPVGYPKEAKK